MFQYQKNDSKDNITFADRLRHKKVTAIGIQRSGLAVVDLCRKFNIDVCLSDCRVWSQIPIDIRRRIIDEDIPCEVGAHSEAWIFTSDLIVISPGVPLTLPILIKARQRGIPILGEVEFAYQFCQGQVIAVTGSNGKTTVVNLIHQLLKQEGYHSRLCGNVGVPFSHVVLDSHADFFVVECSSFQLESLSMGSHNSFESQILVKGFQPFIACLLNISENHLDRHGDMDHYIQSKLNMFRHQDGKDFAIVNEKLLHLFKKCDAKSQPKSFCGSTEHQDPNIEVLKQVAQVLGVDDSQVTLVRHAFKGIEHRNEFVGRYRDVIYINDSKSTTTVSCEWALEKADRPVILICGGRDKDISFDHLQPLFQKKVKHMVVYGESALKIARACSETPLDMAESFESAIQLAHQHADPGDCVLLSPMCTSFDMFNNYEERGRRFKELVTKLHSSEEVLCEN